MSGIVTRDLSSGSEMAWLLPFYTQRLTVRPRPSAECARGVEPRQCAGGWLSERLPVSLPFLEIHGGRHSSDLHAHHGMFPPAFDSLEETSETLCNLRSHGGRPVCLRSPWIWAHSSAAFRKPSGVLCVCPFLPFAARWWVPLGLRLSRLLGSYSHK